MPNNFTINPPIMACFGAHRFCPFWVWSRSLTDPIQDHRQLVVIFYVPKTNLDIHANRLHVYFLLTKQDRHSICHQFEKSRDQLHHIQQHWVTGLKRLNSDACNQPDKPISSKIWLKAFKRASSLSVCVCTLPHPTQ